MDKLKEFFYSNIFLKINFYFFILVYVLLIISFSIHSGFVVNNGDNYILMFQEYIQNGYYKQVVNGTSIFFNLSLSFLNSFVNNDIYSFFILNLFSQIFIIFYSFYVLKKYKQLNDNYFFIVSTIFILYLVNQKYYLSTSNDYFLAVFILLFINSLLELKTQSSLFLFTKLGVYLGLALSIRATSVVLLFLFLFKFGFYVIYSENTTLIKTKSFFVFLFSLTSIIFIFHFPSIFENRTLSYENKNPKNYNVNWIQRNYLGLKKIEKQNLKPNRDVIWKQTPFSEVDAYQKKNGVESLPNSFLSFLLKDPLLLFKISFYNLLTCIARFFRFWGFLIFLLPVPLFDFIKKRNLENSMLVQPSMFFIIMAVLFSTICLTFIEFRWFVGYEVLVPIAILQVYNKILDANFKNVFLSLSLIVISLFNIKSIISYV